jgi:hypothetical protein
MCAGDTVWLKPVATPSAPWRRLGNLGARARLRSGQKQPTDVPLVITPSATSMSVSSQDHTESLRTGRNSLGEPMHSDGQTEVSMILCIVQHLCWFANGHLTQLFQQPHKQANSANGVPRQLSLP